MRKSNLDLFGWGVVAFFACMFIYHAWQYLLGVLALFGAWYLVEQIQRNNRPPNGR